MPAAAPVASGRSALLRQWIGPYLEVYKLRLLSATALDMPHHLAAVGRPEAAALPAGLRVVDAAVHTLGMEAHRIRHAQEHCLAVGHRRLQRVGIVAEAEGHVVAKAARVELVHERVVVRVGAP